MPTLNRNAPETGDFVPEPAPGDAEAPMHQPVELKDIGIRLFGIPFFGLIIPQFTGLFGEISPRTYIYWAGVIYFILLSFCVWQGNRFFLLQQRKHYDWFHQPIRKISILLFANVFYTAPVTVGMLVLWYRFAGFSTIDWDAIKVVTLCNVICVIFITHVYETVYLIQQRESDLVAVAQLQRARIQAELEALKNQIDPHFIFNSLNTLSYLIENEREKALTFNDSLSDVYRYILMNKDRELVYLSEELEFLQNYCSLLKLRFTEGLVVHIPDFPEHLRFLVPPMSLQIPLENAVKHNEISRENPLDIQYVLQESFIVVTNPVHPRINRRPSAGVGLKNLSERYRIILKEDIEVIQENDRFIVRLPVLKTA